MPHQLRMCSNAHLQYAISIVIHKNQFVNKDFKAAVRLVIVQANFLSVLQLEIPSLLSASQHERAAVIAGMARRRILLSACSPRRQGRPFMEFSVMTG